MTLPRREKFKSKLSEGKLMATVFWDDKGVIIILLASKMTVNSDCYTETPRKVSKSIALSVTMQRYPQV